MLCIRGSLGLPLENREGGLLGKAVGRLMRMSREEGSLNSHSTTPHASKPTFVSLEKSRLHVITPAKYCRIACTTGTAWITSQTRACDFILAAGESVLLRGEGKIIISGGCGSSSVKIWSV